MAFLSNRSYFIVFLTLFLFLLVSFPLDAFSAPQQLESSAAIQNLVPDELSITDKNILVYFGGKSAVYALCCLAGFLALVLVAGSILLKFNEKYMGVLPSTHRVRLVVVAGFMLCALLMTTAGFYAFEALEEKQKQTIELMLETMLTSTQGVIVDQLDQEKDAVETLASSAPFVQFSTRLLAGVPRRQALKEYAEKATQRYGYRLLQDQSLDFFIISPGGDTLYAPLPFKIGSRNFLADIAPTVLQTVFEGKTITVYIPQGSLGYEDGESEPLSLRKYGGRFYVIAPVVGAKANIIAAVVRPSLSSDELSLLCGGSGIVDKGELYLVTSDGYMVGQSRFLGELIDSGLQDAADPGQRLRLAYPGAPIQGGNLTVDSSDRWPLTLMASQIVERQSALEMTEYYNYLGNKVVGLWRWDNTLSMGVAIEMSVAELERTFSGLTMVIKTSLIICGIMGLLLVSILLFYIERARRTLRRAHDRWEKLAESRLVDLKNKEEWYALVLASTKNGIWDWDVQSNELSFSDIYLSILGYSAAEFPTNYHTWLAYVHPGDRDKLEEVSSPCLRGDVEKFTAEFRMKHKKGYWVWILGTGNHVKNDRGEVVRLAGAVADITEKKIAEVRLEQSERKFSAVFNQSIRFTAILGVDGQVLELNAYAQKFTGHLIDEIAGTQVWDAPWVKSSEGLPEYLRDVVKQVSDGNIVNFEREVIDDEQRNVILDTTLSPIRNEDGGVEFILVQGQDVTQTRNSEQSLRASEQRFRDMFHNSPVVYYSLNESGIIADCNDKFTETLGFSRAEVLGCPIQDFYAVDSHAMLNNNMEQLKKDGVCEGEVVLVHRNGIKIHFIHSARLQHDVNGQFVRNHSILLNITERKKAEILQAQLEAFFENYPDIAYIRDTDGCFVMINKSLEKGLKTSKENILGKKIDDFFTGEEAERHNVSFNTVLKSQKPLLFDSHIVYQGVVKYYHGSIFPIKDKAGHIRSIATIVQDRTIEILRQQEVDELQGRLNAILDNTPAAIFMQDLDGHFMFVNNSWSKYQGVQLDGVIGKSIEEIYDPQGAKALRDAFQRVLTTDTSEVWENEQGIDGGNRVFQNQTFPVRDSEKNVLAIGHICTEVTEQRLAQSELRKAQSVLKSIMDNSSAMVFAKDLSGKYTMMNESFCDFWGIDSLKDIGKNDAEIFPVPLADQYRRDDLEIIEAGCALSQEDQLVSPVDGMKRIMLVEKFLIYNEMGGVSGTGGIATDVTAIKKIQERLKDSEERLRFSLASMGTYYWEYNFVEDRLEYDSNEFFGQYGYTLHERPITFKEYTACIYPDDAIDLLTAFQAHVDKKVEVFKTEYRFRARDGHWFWNLTMGRVIERGDDGEPLRISGITFDISERKELESWLILEREKAETAAEVKGHFMANMSHEIRTPMNAIIGLCYLLNKTNMSASQKNYLSKIDSSSQSLLNIINDILDFSKIEAGKIALEETEFSLEHIAGQLNGYFGHLAQSKGLTLSIRLKDTIPPVLLGDSYRLEQILTNLVSNAVKFTENGAISVRVNVLESLGDKVMLEFTVHDTGIGMVPQEIDKIFEAFSQADSTTSRRFGGTGLGLSITHSLVQMMGGKIAVESVVGEGTTFSFSVLLGISQQAIIVDAGTLLIPDLSGVKILLAEDNILNQEVVVGILEETGCEMTLVSNGSDALACMQNEQFDIVLMDVQMYGMDGLEATQKMRHWERENNRKHIPILALTAGVLKEDRLKTEEAGMDGHINKPILPKKLFAEVVKWTSRFATLQLPNGDSEDFSKECYAELREMDVSKALTRLGNRSSLLFKLLTHFVTNQSCTVADINKALSEGDREHALRIVHTLKGVAGTLEARELREDAVCLERALQAGEKDLEEILSAVDTKIISLVASAEVVLNSRDGQSQSSPIDEVDKSELEPLLAKLAVYLEQGDPQALQCLDNLVELGLTDHNFPRVTELRALVAKYAFEEALDLLS